MVVKPIKSQAEFDAALVSSKLVVFDFWAEWCAPCKMVAPFVERLSESDFAETAEFYKVDVDEVPEVAGSLGVTAMPTFFLFKDGKKVGQTMGANSSALKTAIQKNL